MVKYSSRFLMPVLLVIYPLVACQGPIVEGAPRLPIREVLQDLADDDTALAIAFVESPLFDQLEPEDYPVTIFFIAEDKFDIYLSENSLTREAFLASNKRDDFLESFIIEGVTLPEVEGGTYTTKAGNVVTTSNISEPGLDGAFTLNINDSPARCAIYVAEEKGASICDIEGPLVDFNW